MKIKDNLSYEELKRRAYSIIDSLDYIDEYGSRVGHHSVTEEYIKKYDTLALIDLTRADESLEIICDEIKEQFEC